MKKIVFDEYTHCNERCHALRSLLLVLCVLSAFVRRQASCTTSVTMGKNQHSKDRLFVTATEWREQYGGKKKVVERIHKCQSCSSAVVVCRVSRHVCRVSRHGCPSS